MARLNHIVEGLRVCFRVWGLGFKGLGFKGLGLRVEDPARQFAEKVSSIIVSMRDDQVVPGDNLGIPGIHYLHYVDASI